MHCGTIIVMLYDRDDRVRMDPRDAVTEEFRAVDPVSNLPWPFRQEQHGPTTLPSNNVWNTQLQKVPYPPRFGIGSDMPMDMEEKKSVFLAYCFAYAVSVICIPIFGDYIVPVRFVVYGRL
jgi:hypothetical protein